MDGHLGQFRRCLEHLAVGYGKVRQGLVAAHRHHLHRGYFVFYLCVTLQAFRIGYEQARRSVVEGIGQLFGHPPGIHAHCYGTNGDAGPVAQHPLGIVAHGDRHPVMLLYAVFRHPAGDTRRDFLRLRVGETLSLVDQIVGIAVPARLLPDFPQRAGGIAPGL